MIRFADSLLSVFGHAALRRWWLLLFFGLSALLSPAQQIENYPVNTTAYFAAPFSQRLSDYFSSDKRLIVDLLLKDLTKTSVEVYLRWSIEGVGIRVQSREGYLPPTFITLQRGIVARQRGSDLQAAYFSPQAIETQGLDPASIYTLELPEGFYTFRAQAIEAATGQVVSNVSETYMVLSYPQPPMLNLPFVGSEVPVMALQKVLFSWSPRHFASPTTNAVYRLQVCEVPEEFEPTEQVMLTCTEPRLDVTVGSTSYAGDVTSWVKPLEVGHRYATQVTVTDLSGELGNFVNQGRSQVSWFRYGKECSPPVFRIAPLGTDRVQLSWEGVLPAQGYVVEYKAATATDWQAIASRGNSQVVEGLKPTVDYLFRLRSDCGGVALSAASPEQSYNLVADGPSAPPALPGGLVNPLTIGVQVGGGGVTQFPTSLSALYSNFPRPGLPASTARLPTSASGLTQLKLPYCAALASSFADCQAPLPSVALPVGDELGSLQVGDVLGIYDYAVFVTKVGGGPALSGEGLVVLPFMGGALGLVEFSGVQAKAGEPGSNGGCVYNTAMPGYFRIKSATQQAVLAAQQGLIAQVVGTGVYVGTLGDALSKYDSLVAGLSQPPTAGNRQLLLQYLTAIEQGSTILKTQFDSVYGERGDPGAGPIRDSLGVLLNEVKTALSNLQGGATTAVFPRLLSRYKALFDRLAQLTTPLLPTPTPFGPTLNPVILSNLGTTSTTIDWQGDGVFSRYVVHYQLENAGELLQTVSSPHIELQNLKPGSNYTFIIEGYGEKELLATYGRASFTTLQQIVPMPENLAYTAQDDHTVKITWDKNKEHLTYKLVYTEKTGQQRTLYPTTNQAILTVLATDASYPYTLVAYGNNNLASDASSSTFLLGRVCRLVPNASASRIIEGETVVLSINENSCRDAKNELEGIVTWEEVGGKIKQPGRTLTVQPSETTTYIVTCIMPSREENSSAAPMVCSQQVKLTVDKRCTGVVATVTPTIVNTEQPVVLQSTGCAGNVRWSIGYPVDGGLVSTHPSTVIYSKADQNKTQTYTLSCLDQAGVSCLLKAGSVYTKCEFKLGVTNQSNGDFLLSKKKKKVFVDGVGCPSEIIWERDGGNVNITTTIEQKYSYLPSKKIIFGNIRTGFTVNATCGVTGCKATTGYIDVPPHSSLCDGENPAEISVYNRGDGYLLTIEKGEFIEPKNGWPGRWSSTKTDLPFIWDDNGSDKNPRFVSLPKTPTIFSASFNGCKVATAIEYIAKTYGNYFSISLPPIPCNEFTAVSNPANPVIPWNGSSVKDISLTASGCVNPAPGLVIWKDQTGKTIDTGITGTTSVSFTQPGSYTFSATCALTGETKNVTIAVTKGQKPPVNFTVTTPVNDEIWNSAIDVVLKSSGCVDADPAIGLGKVMWSNSNGDQIAADKTGSVTQRFTKAGIYIFSATCSLNGEKKNVTVNITQRVEVIPTDPCGLIIYTNSASNSFPTNSYTNIEITIFGGESVFILPRNGSPPVFPIGNGKYSLSTSSITQPTVFSYLITNTNSSGICDYLLVINMYDPIATYWPFVPSVVTPPTAIYPNQPNGNCVSYYSFGASGATFGIPYNPPNNQVSKVRNNNQTNLGVFAIYSTKTNNYSEYNLPDFVGLVDKQCDAKKGLLRFYSDNSRSIKLPYGALVAPLLHVSVPRPTANTTYYGRCFYKEGYCDTQITLSTNINGGGRVGTEDSTSTDGARVAAERPCMYSNRDAAKVLLTNVLCDKLSALPGNEAQQLSALRSLLQQQGIALAQISPAMVADLQAGKCAQVVAALTQPITGTQKVDQLQKLINQKLADQLVSDVLSNDINQCPIETLPVVEQELASGNGRIAAYSIDPNRLFIAPDGRAVNLPQGATPKFFNFNGSWGTPPAGTLQGFITADGTLYFAHIINSPQTFKGYAQVKSPFCPTNYKDDIYMPVNATVSTAVYYFDYYNTNNECGYRWVEGTHSFEPTADHSLVAIQPVVVGASTNVTALKCGSGQWVRGTDGVRRRTITIEGNTFGFEDRGGTISVKGKWQTFGKCGECPAKAEAALQAALAKVPGKLTEQTVVVGATTQSYGSAGTVVYSPMKVMDLLQNLSKTYNSLVEKAKVPDGVWKPQQDLPGPDKNFFVQDKTGVISGAIDQAVEEVTDLPQLVGLGLSLVSDPEGAYNQLSTFAQTMSWDKAQDLAECLAKDAVQYDNFSKGGAYARYGTGRVGVTIGLAVATGGLLAMVQDAPNQLKKSLDDLAALLDNTGKFVDAVLEANYQQYLLRKISQTKPPRERLDWKKERDYWLNDSPIARGNAFNAKSVRDRWYPVNELNLSNGKRLDSYLPPSGENTGEIVSRKATNLDDIELSTFETYLKEMQIKYAPGNVIRSNKYPSIDGQILQGKQILEIPVLNQNFSQLQDYTDLAKNKYNIEIRLRPE